MGSLEVARAAKAKFSGFADNEVVMQGQTESLGSGANLVCHRDIGGGWCRIARGMIMHQINAVEPISRARFRISRG